VEALPVLRVVEPDGREIALKEFTPVYDAP